MFDQNIYDEVINFIRDDGPALPMDVSYIIKKDSFISNAILAELISNQKIKRTKRTYGNSPIYYYEGQEEQALKKLFEDLKDNEKKLVEKFHRDKVIFEDELEPQERFLLTKLSDFLLPYTIKVGEQNITCHKIHNLKEEFFNQLLNEKMKLRLPKEPEEEKKKESVQSKIDLPKVEDTKHAIVEVKPKSVIKVEKQDVLKTRVSLDNELETKVGEIVSGLQGEILDKSVITKNKEIDFKAKISGLVYTVKIKKKANINESDLSMIYTQVMDEKRPIILVTNGKISKKAKDFKDKKIGDLIRILNI